MKTITGHVVYAAQVGTSGSGNPTIRVTIEQQDGQLHRALTVIDSQLGLAIRNLEYRENNWDFKLDADGRLQSATPAKVED